MFGIACLYTKFSTSRYACKLLVARYACSSSCFVCIFALVVFDYRSMWCLVTADTLPTVIALLLSNRDRVSKRKWVFKLTMDLA